MLADCAQAASGAKAKAKSERTLMLGLIAWLALRCGNPGVGDFYVACMANALLPHHTCMYLLRSVLQDAAVKIMKTAKAKQRLGHGYVEGEPSQWRGSGALIFSDPINVTNCHPCCQLEWCIRCRQTQAVGGQVPADSPLAFIYAAQLQVLMVGCRCHICTGAPGSCQQIH